MAISAPSAERSPMHPTPAVSAWLLQEAGVGILREVIEHCDAAAIPVVAVKGVVTSHVLYDDVAERPMTDVDIRVRPQDLGRFERLAAAAAWRRLRVARSYGNLIYDFGALSLDVESYVGPPGLCSLSVDTMLDRAERREIAPGLLVPVPELHDHAVLLTVNVFKDKIVTAQSWAIADLERIVEHPHFNRDVFVDRVGQSHVATLSWIVAQWMASVRQSDAWREIRGAIESRMRVRRTYARRFLSQLATAHQAPISLRLLARVAADAPVMRFEALARAVACTGESWLRESRLMKR